VVLSKKDSVYNNFGEYEVRVKEEEVLVAMKIISDDILLG
jgi:hypothetical protein